MVNISSTMGMKTREWGPGAWKFLFASIMGAYPPRIDERNREHKRTRKYFYYMFKSLGYTMGCVFCRQSFKTFWKQLPIRKFMDTRVNMMYWLYLMKDKVNRKLIKQEDNRLAAELARLKLERLSGKITAYQYEVLMRKAQDNCFHTTPSPPFHEVLEYYEAMRAPCSKQAQTCN
jgi:hypothetical protein